MKAQLFTLIFLLIDGFAFSQYTLIPDPNFEEFLEDNGMGDGIVGNGQVLTANIENVAELSLIGLEIQDLTGIQDFAMLEDFVCSLNPVTEMDLSQNSHLKLIAVYRLFLLDDLDVTGLEELEELDVIESLMPSITLGFHPNLTYLDFTGNTLTSIDVSQCPVLEHLDITENYISELDISQNPNLIQLWTPLNPLNSLDTSFNPNLEVFSGALAQLTQYDFSQNPNLYSVGIGESPNLEYIDMRNGNNEIVQHFFVGVNSEELKCVYVDDATAPYLEDWNLFNGTFVNNEAECEALHTEEVDTNEFLLYPNPVKDKIFIKNDHQTILKVKILDIQGRKVMEKRGMQDEIEIDLRELPSGVYFVITESKDNILKTEKIIKQ